MPAVISPSMIGCTLVLDVTAAATVVIQVAAAHRENVIKERLDITSGTAPALVQELTEAVGGRPHLVRVEPGLLTVRYDATVASVDRTPSRITDEQLVDALRPSRYCPSDRLSGFANANFGHLPTAAERVRAICDYVWSHVAYVSDTSGSSTDAVDTLLAGRGVCRDFAHLVAALCRAVEVPARMASVYAPGLSPMDFHAVVEAAIDGRWQVWDATRSAPRQTMVRIATGRDAADIAFTTVTTGRAELRGLDITAVAGADLPIDGHDQPESLA
jgi:transglutaminase-like putative cysteine protease